jgi:hypothetical protein
MNTVVTPMPSSNRDTGSLVRAGHWLNRAAGALRRALEASAQARAQAHVREFAQRCEALQPELAKELRQACAGARHVP